MRFVVTVTALMIALSSVIALSPRPGLAQKMLDSKKKEDQSSSQKKSSEDRDYKSAVDRLPDQKFDPWRNMR